AGGRRQEAGGRRQEAGGRWLLAIGIILRLTLLGGAEFQGDEARAMLLAVGVSQGDDGILLTHTKGPIEALIPAGPLILAGAGAEWVARLPFALAGIGLLLGVVAIVREIWPDSVRRSTIIAVVSIALLASDGFALGFSRIVQYQSVVLLMSAGAFWCCWRFYAGAEQPARYLVSAAALLAVGLLAHYDAAMVAPALAWLVIAGGWRRGWRWREWLRGLGIPALLGAALLTSFYLPYVTSASFGATAEYLAGRAGQSGAGGPPFNNLPLYLSISSFYNAPPLVPILAVALFASFCLLPFAPRGVAALALWFAVPFLAESFLIAEPRTHFYSAHPAAALIIGYGVAWLAGKVPSVNIPLRLGGVLWLAVSLSYAQLLYLRPFPEYQRSFPAARPAIMRASYGDKLPEAGYFGFPHSDGWKAVAELYRAGVIVGSYDTNQNRWLVGWYLRNTPRCATNPDYYLIANAEATRYFPPGYHLFGEVTLGPTRTLAIYSRMPVAGSPQIFSGEELAAAFDARPVEPFPAAAILADSSNCGL
ncbi:MAG: glycosyltransferase family 39 protein, partial [Chloroflexales bacterium]